MTTMWVIGLLWLPVVAVACVLLCRAIREADERDEEASRQSRVERAERPLRGPVSPSRLGISDLAELEAMYRDSGGSEGGRASGPGRPAA
jgi:hypothetical protein